MGAKLGTVLVVLLLCAASASLAQEPAALAAAASADGGGGGGSDGGGTDAPAAVAAADSPQAQADFAAMLDACGTGEWQLVMCGDIPLDQPARRAACCAAASAPPTPPPPAAPGSGGGPSAKAAGPAPPPRPDLSLSAPSYMPSFDWAFGLCTARLSAAVPSFYRDARNRTRASLRRFSVPSLRAPALVARVKAAALAAAPQAVQDAYAAAPPSTGPGGFAHPAGPAGAGELALLNARLAASDALAGASRDGLLSGSGVPPKVYPGGWSFRVDTPAAGYEGPFPMQTFMADYGGVVIDQKTCPPNYPSGAPRSLCGHISLVEADGAMAQKQALAYAATGDERHAALAAGIVAAWAANNTVFGRRDRNGPLEAGWACGPMARTMELLRVLRWPGLTPQAMSSFLSWLSGVLLPQMDHFAYTITPTAINAGTANVYSNWHATIAECMMAAGALADNRTRFDMGVALYRATLGDYLKWGKGVFAAGRLLGEATETLRDIYHTEFGLGSLLQAAEAGWAQDMDLYSEGGHALAAAMELHARIILAGLDGDEGGLPPGFKFFSSMPKPPAGCTWRWDGSAQAWASFTAANVKCSDLADGFKYILGISWLPTGWELGYNHYVGRLGMKLPQTAALLARFPVDYQLFGWGLGTLTHANTAGQLWRAGLKKSNACKRYNK